MRNYIYLLACMLVYAAPSAAQTFDAGNVSDNFKKKNLLKLNGGLSANGLFYTGSGEAERDPFTWFVSGNVNARIFNLIDLPFSLFLTNAGHGLSYPTPPTRISVHPSYKWATAHIGDVAMSWSPYTLNGHQFTGVGIDLAPPGKWRGSAMWGRLQQAEQYQPENHSVQAAYRRMGYGARLEYVDSRYRVGYNFFTAKDDQSSINYVPDSLGIHPQQNIAMSFTGAVAITKSLELSGEYATSALTENERDTTAVDVESNHVFNVLMKQRATTGYYHAIRAALNYTIKNTVVGLGYERVDPGYRTLGAYFFNEDLENYTLNVAQPLFDKKVNLALSAGFQRDDLNGDKSGITRRIIGSLNATYTPNDRIFAMLSYSNFQTHMYIKPQFESINQLNPYQTYDTLNFTQISQNAMANVSYIFKKSETRTSGVNVNLTALDAVERQGDEIHTGGASRFYNTGVMYTMGFVPRKLNVSAGFNLSYNIVGRMDAVTWGPIATISSRNLGDKLNSSLALSYNASSLSGLHQGSTFNIRLNAGYALMKRQSLNLGIMSQNIFNSSRGNSSNMLINLGYNFSF